jgi:HK97 family phage portal protein
MSAPVKQRTGRALKDVFPAFFGWFFGGRAKLTDPNEVDYSSADPPSGMSVDLNSTLQLSAAWSCIRLLSETIATLPLNIYKRGGDNARSPATRFPLYELLHNAPNADMTAVSFWQAYVAGMLTCGYGAAEKIVFGDQLVALDLLFGPDLSSRKTKTGVEYVYHDYRTGKERTIRSDRVWITPAFSLDGRFGLSPIRYGSGVLGTAIAADQSAARWFGQGMRPSGVLSTDKILTPTQREDMRTNITEKFSGVANSSKTMVLEAGLKYQTISLPPEEAQLLQTRSFGVEEVCRWFGVPPIMVGHSDKVTAWGTGIEQIVIGFLTFSLRPWLTRIEQSIRQSLLTPEERAKYFAEFAVEGLLRADSPARAAFYSQMTQNGIYTRNEVRKLENLPPVDGGDAVTVQSNLISIDQLGSTPSAEQQLSSALAQLMKRHESNDSPTQRP